MSDLDVALVAVTVVLVLWTSFVYWYGLSLGKKIGAHREAERWKPVVETVEELCGETLKHVSTRPREEVGEIARLSAKTVGTMMDVIAKWPR